ncbi:MAG: hypothetical protein C4567_18020 [Deltaproteobacteria bacterium]|nr:MAG: hypothetical protein C4567_18020 [Deltaproteobacteria bacterium]
MSNFNSNIDNRNIEERKLLIKQKKLELDEEKEKRTIWRQEDLLINNRLTWLLVSQALLFAAYGWVMKGDICKPELLIILLFVIPCIGFIISYLILISIYAAKEAQVALKDTGVIYWGSMGVSERTTYLGYVAPFGIPVSFMLAWLVLFSYVADISILFIIPVLLLLIYTTTILYNLWFDF